MPVSPQKAADMRQGTAGREDWKKKHSGKVYFIVCGKQGNYGDAKRQQY